MAAFDSNRVPLNKVCRVSDSANPAWRQGYDDLGFPAARETFHRKVWEFNQALYGLRTLQRLMPDSVAIGIGCGHEELMYFLASRIAHVVATDLYQGSYLGGESDADVLDHPEKYAPFAYRRDHLEVRRWTDCCSPPPPARLISRSVFRRSSTSAASATSCRRSAKCTGYSSPAESPW